METMSHTYLLSILVAIFAVPLHAVTVKPCPTNKIAPHRRIMSWERPQARTLGAFYDLLAPNNQQGAGGQSGSLQEPQIDDPDDCGDIEDYDENDIGSLTSQRRQGVYNSRLLFSGLQQPQPTSSRPPARPQRQPYPATRPPYWSGGFFGNNPYRPPSQQYPSNNVKPVHEGDFETQMPYRPDVVGGPIGHVVGVTQVRPTRRPLFDVTTQSYNYPTRPTPNYDNYPTRPPQNNNINFATRPRPNYDNDPTRPPQNNNFNYPTRPTPNYDNYPTRPPQNNNINYSTRPTPNYNNYPTIPPQNNNINYPARPTPNYNNYPTRPPQNHVNNPTRPTQDSAHANRRPRPRNLNYSTSVLGSFVDLFLK